MRWLVVLIGVTLLGVPVRTQAGGAPPPREAGPQAVAAPYAYRADGRRDPFISLTNGDVDLDGAARRGDGPAGFLLGEVSVRGVMQSRGALIAMIQGPDDKTYLIRQGGKLADGIVKSVTAQGLIVLQDVNDPLSVQKQREVRKLLRSLEDAKP